MPMLKMLTGLVAVVRTRVVRRAGRSQDGGGRGNLPAPRVHEAMAIAERMSVKTCRTPGCPSAHVKGPPGGRLFVVGDRVRRRDEPDGVGTVTERWDTGHLIVKWDGRPNDQLFGETGLVWLDGGLCFRCHDRAWFAPRSKVEGPCDGHPTTELTMFMTYAAFLITIAAYAVFLIAACAAFN